MFRFFVSLCLLAAGCGTTSGSSCTEIGCESSLSVTVTDANGDEVSGLQGTVTLGGHEYAVDCVDSANSDAQVTCDGGTITVSILHPNEGATASVDLTTDAGDTATSKGIKPDWTDSQPNGDGCPPVCGAGEATVEVDVI